MSSPLDWLDLRDRRGRVDNQKLLPLVLFAAALAFQALRNPIPTSALTVLGAIAFGPRMYGLFLRARAGADVVGGDAAAGEPATSPAIAGHAYDPGA